jgi:hypothetical protein
MSRPFPKKKNFEPQIAEYTFPRSGSHYTIAKIIQFVSKYIQCCIEKFYYGKYTLLKIKFTKS